MARQFHLIRSTFLPRATKKEVSMFDDSVTVMRVWPTDLDFYLHVNNGSYLQMMDVARTNWTAELGGMTKLRAKGWYPVVAANTVRYRKSLLPWQKFEIHTRLLGWDGRMNYIEQDVVRGGVLYAQAFIAGRFLGRGGERIAPADVVKLLTGEVVESPALPEKVLVWAQTLGVADRNAL
ncbi:MAG: acyl-CoA thioesterase [Microbacteriaceae bacterium]